MDPQIGSQARSSSSQTSIPETQNTIDLEAIRSAELSNEEIIELISYFCSAESVIPYAQHIRILYEKYNMEYEMRTLDVEVLSLREKFDLRKLRNYYLAMGSEGYESLIIDLIRGYQSDPSANVYADRLEKAFDHQPDEKFIRGLLRFMDSFDGETDFDLLPGIVHLRRHFQYQLDKIAAYAPIPDYIKNFGIVVRDLPHLEEKEISGDLPPQLIAEYLINQLGNLDVQIEETDDMTPLETLTTHIESMTVEQRNEFANLFKVDPDEVQRLRDNRDIFRVYGPVNPYPDTDYSQLKKDPEFITNDFNQIEMIEGEPNVNVIFGGARMFTDMDLEYDYDGDLPMEDWFIGVCHQCNKRIRSYHHAVRIPHTVGGWRGCFCNWKCSKEFIEIDNLNDPDEYNLMQIQLALISEFENLTNEIGIEDRDYEVKDEEEDEINQDEVDELAAKLPKWEVSLPPIPSVSEDD